MNLRLPFSCLTTCLPSRNAYVYGQDLAEEDAIRSTAAYTPIVKIVGTVFACTGEQWMDVRLASSLRRSYREMRERVKEEAVMGSEGCRRDKSEGSGRRDTDGLISGRWRRI